MMTTFSRTVISSMSCTSSQDSMVVQAYVLVDPSKENLYFSSTPWSGSFLHPSCTSYPGFQTKAG